MSKSFKKIIIGLIGFFVLVYVATLFLKKDYKVKVNVSINQSQTKVFNYLKHIKNQTSFLTWLRSDSLIKITSEGKDGAKGFILKWQSEQMGEGEEEIMAIKNGKRVDFQFRFIKPVKSQSNSYMIADSIGVSQTKITWVLEGEIPYPANVMMLFMDINDSIGGELQRSLEGIKGILESEK